MVSISMLKNNVTAEEILAWYWKNIPANDN
jgi:hypothetical protein